MKDIYQLHRDLVLKTGVRNGGIPDDTFIRLNSILGLCGEVAELMEATDLKNTEKIIDETGDVLWYLNYLSLAMGDTDDTLVFMRQTIENSHPPAFLSQQMALKEMVIQSGAMADILKKNLCHFTPLKESELFDAFIKMLINIAHFCKVSGFSVQSALSRNITKLEKRYPNGFTPEASIKRADEAPAEEEGML